MDYEEFRKPTAGTPLEELGEERERVPKPSKARKDLEAFMETEPRAASRAPRNYTEETIEAMSEGVAEVLDIPGSNAGKEYAESIVREMVDMAMEGRGERITPRVQSKMHAAEGSEEKTIEQLASALVNLVEWPGSSEDYDVAETIVKRSLEGTRKF
jgi:hypothetical protein